MSKNDEIAEAFVRSCEAETGKQISADKVETLSGLLTQSREEAQTPATLPMMLTKAFRTSFSCGPDRIYEMRFAFGSLEDLQLADDEWTAFTAPSAGGEHD